MVSRRAVIRGLAAAAAIQGFLTIQPALAEPGKGAVPTQAPAPAQAPAGQETAAIIGVL